MDFFGLSDAPADGADGRHAGYHVGDCGSRFSVGVRCERRRSVIPRGNEAAMSKMMAAMAVKPSGDVDTDFVATMVPHHQGAIEMAQAELRHGHNEQLRRIAQEIIVDQTQEIAAMQLAVEQEPRK